MNAPYQDDVEIMKMYFYLIHVDYCLDLQMVISAYIMIVDTWLIKGVQFDVCSQKIWQCSDSCHLDV